MEGFLVILPDRQDDLAPQKLEKNDWDSLVQLLRTEPRVHRHLGWIPPLDWLGSQPYWGLFQGGKITAALACPPDPPAVSWIQLFAVSRRLSVERSWNLMWPLVQAQLKKKQVVESVNAIAIQDWFQDLLAKKGFHQAFQVLILHWESAHSAFLLEDPQVSVRAMQLEDLPGVQRVDQKAFGPIWRNSLAKLKRAHEMAAVATVVEEEGQIIGYQISTAGAMGGHLARLAVLPDYQGQGVGTALVVNLLKSFEKQGFVEVTVNTQSNNMGSIKLYKKLGFVEGPDSFPVYQLDLGEGEPA
jgi:ribosomal-protein-alanine N-acetyltransferase